MSRLLPSDASAFSEARPIEQRGVGRKVGERVRKSTSVTRPRLAHSQRLCQVKSLSPHHRFVIALSSPDRVIETGLRMCPPEKGPQIDALRSRAVRSLRSTLRTKYCEIRACLAYFAAKGGAVSLQFRLAGGEGGIRTLGTGVSPYNGLANGSFSPPSLVFKHLQSDG